MKYFLSLLILLPSLAYSDTISAVNYGNKILGKWTCSEDFKTENSSNKITFDTNYVRNGKFSGFGKLTMNITRPDGLQVSMDYAISTSGSWEIKDNKYLVETNDEVKSVNTTNPEIDKIISLNDLIPKNISSSSEIIKIGDNILVTKDESDGKISSCYRESNGISKMTDSDSIIYFLTYNKDGAALKNASGDTIYLGNSCDSYSARQGSGKWGHSNEGMMVILDNNVVAFPNQTLNIKNCSL